MRTEPSGGGVDFDGWKEPVLKPNLFNGIIIVNTIRMLVLLF